MIDNIKGTDTVSQSYSINERQNAAKSEVSAYKEEPAATLELGKATANSATYSKPKARALDTEEINKLWEQSQESYNTLRKLVEALLYKQGKTLEDVKSGKEALVVDEETRAAAAEAVSENGELGVKAVSERIVTFAKSISGDDRSKAGELREAIRQGFKEAEKVWGGKLPEISQKTYDEVMKQLDEWEKG